MIPASESSPLPADSRRRWMAGLAAFGGLGLLSLRANAQGAGWRDRPDPEERARRLDWRIGRLVQEVGGTQQQQERLAAIASAARAELKPLRDQSRELRRQRLDLLATPVIDRVALERARVAEMQLKDARSRRTLQAMADAAEVFTPEQRVKVAEHMKQRTDRRRRG
jgi:periplasmic protein CpxP/Spy